MGDSSSYKDYVAGLVAGVATVITGHPFDTVKVSWIVYSNYNSFDLLYASSLILWTGMDFFSFSIYYLFLGVFEVRWQWNR